jgi:cell division septal protein FtsQ
MTRKYIKNCTGEQCEDEKTNSYLVSKIIFYTLLVCFMGVSFYVLFFSQYLQITDITVTGTTELNSQEIQQNIEESLQGKYLGVIPKNNFLFISQKKNEDLLIGNFKKIRSVMVTRKFPNALSIAIDERKALLVWCSNEKCYLLDEKGVAYNEAVFSSPELEQNHLLQINDLSSREVKIGEKIIEPVFEQYVLGIKDALAVAGFNATQQYSTPSRMAEEINVKTDQESEFYFSTQFDLLSAFRTLNAMLKKEISQEQRSNIAYIDLRNENKAFYKFKNTQPIAENQPIAIVEDKKEEKKN